MTASHPPAASETPELKPCPFCGNEDFSDGIVDENEGIAHTPMYRVVCHTCGVSTGEWRQIELAAAIWNSRAAAASVESDPAPELVSTTNKFDSAAPVAGIDVEATQKLLRQAAERVSYYRPSEMADELNALADALPSLVSGQADTGRLDEDEAIFRWLLGEEGDFPESLPGRRYGFRSELRQRLAARSPRGQQEGQ